MIEPALSLAQHLHAAARRIPDSPALLTGDGNWDFKALWEETRRRAAALENSNLPLPWSGCSTELALAAYAGSLAGRPFWPLAPDRPTPLLHPTPPGTALIVSTSGSEGKPKAAMLSHGNLDAAAAASNARLALGPGDCWLDCLPLHHIGGLSILWRCAQAGAAVVLHDGFDPEDVRRDLAACRVSHISLVPAMLARLLDLGGTPPETLRCALVGGAALSPSLYKRAKGAGWPVVPTYGMTETSAQIVAFDPVDGPWEEGLVGRPLPGTEVAIGDDGRVRVRGPQVMVGYLNPDGRPGLGLEDNWLVTGDRGEIDSRGRLRILGRADDMLVSGGTNVHPLAVESCLAACPGVWDVAVAGIPDPAWGDLVVALVVGEAEEERILAWGRSRLPSAARPRRVLRLDRLPRNALGKLERAAVRALASELYPETSP